MDPILMFILMNVGAGLMVLGVMMLAKGFNPATRHQMRPVLGTALLLVGDTMVLQFGDPALVNMLIERITRLIAG